MNEFVPGQCWISRTETELGLGLVVEVSGPRVTVHFLAAGEQRIYARDNAPLLRVSFKPGDLIETLEGVKVSITDVETQAGLLTYLGQDEQGRMARVAEMELNPHLAFNKPEERLFTGQFDQATGFELRYASWQWRARHQQSSAKGLIGARAALLPHQLYIAHEAAHREPPRIMLADEVGLGKTIEAGLIIHHRLLNGLSRKVLIIVPEPILHQWLVEMLRRFNLRFTLVNADRCAAELSEPGSDKTVKMGENPFAEADLVLCGQNFLTQNPDRQQQALEQSWDLVVIDEAHHLASHGDSISAEYAFAACLAEVTHGLILLTATPEQMGADSHFAQLRLLDPDRYYDFSVFTREQQQFQPVAESAQALLSPEPLTAEQQKALAILVRDDAAEIWLQRLRQPDSEPQAREALLALLLDLHGTGRVLFRNSRHTVKGFPDREVHGYPLTGEAGDLGDADPRCQWLLTFLDKLAGEKALLICHSATTAKALSNWLKNRHGMLSALFHENLSIIERDRAAAYFADPDSPARLLICSEIGSEGRNFQFLRHLVLFDLPDNPELLQQRIGRLDRIGQRRIIQLHIPYIQGSREHGLYRWYDQGLDVFRHTISAAPKVTEQLADELNQALADGDETAWQSLIAKTRPLARQLERELNQGRDVLLELNSCRPEKIQPVLAAIQALEQNRALENYYELLFDYFGLDIEEHSPGCYILKPGKLLRPIDRAVLPETGMTVTYQREQALQREDFQFLTLEHPLPQHLQECLLTSEIGNATIAAIKLEGFSSGQFLVECLFVAEASAPPALHVGRFLPPTPIRILLDKNGRDLSENFPHQALRASRGPLKQDILLMVLQRYRPLLEALIAQAGTAAGQALEIIRNQALETMRREFSAEANRLKRLKRLNPTIDEHEIERLTDAALLLKDAIEQTHVRLDAIRFIVCA